MIVIDENYEGLEIEGSWYVYKGDMIITDNVEIRINLDVEGNQIVKGYQRVEGDQRVEGNQIVEGDQIVEGNQIVEGDMEILNIPTKFNFYICHDTYTINIMSKIIKIGCETHTPEEWESFSDDKINAMDPNALEWWKKWKGFIFTTYDSLVKIYN